MTRFQKTLLALLGSFILACAPKTVTDQSLSADVQAKLAASDATRAAGVIVSVTNGVVTLSGNVSASDAALQAMTIANNTPGIKSVNNQMKVLDASAVPPPPPQNLGGAAPSPAPAYSAPPPPPHSEAPPVEKPMRPLPPPPVIIPVGQPIAVRMIDGIDTGRNHEGETFHASLSSPIVDGDRVIVPTGASATVLLAASRAAGRVKGSSELELRLIEITDRGERIRVESGAYEAKGKARGKETAIRTGIGAAAGALIGGLAGGGKGAGIGAGVGGGAGMGLQLLTHGQQIKIPSETEITFNLAAPLTLPR